MPNLTIKPLGEVFETRPGESIRETLQRNGVSIESPCDGQGICGRCGVWIESPDNVPETPHENISQEQSRQGLRLSCQVIPEQDMTILLPFDFSRDAKRMRQSQRIVEGERLSWSRVVSAVKIMEDDQGKWIFYDGLEQKQPLQVWSKTYTPKGIAIDLGTTTLVVALLSLKTGEELATASSLNPQIRYGHDVMTRIQHGSTTKGLKELSEVVRQSLNDLINQVCTDSSSDEYEIVDLTIGGNTTMLQLLASIDPSPLGQVPFTINIQGGTTYPVDQFGLKVNPAARVYIPPIVHAFIGTDISAGLLMSEGFFEDQESLLYIDIGTNGEMGLNFYGNRVMTSTAAGPAFEGMGLSSGMRASVGAIEEVSTDGKNLKITTIGNAPIKGVCGSGLIDLIASLLRLEVIEPNGRLRHQNEQSGLPSSVASRLEDVNGQSSFKLAEGVYLTQKDIRQIQLAKGAIRAAIDILIKETDSTAEELGKIVIAGGFGFSLNPHNLESLGVIPPGTGDKVRFAGNTSRSGCAWLLTDISYRRFLEQRMRGLEHISIAQKPEFMDRYVESMEFPDIRINNNQTI